jgi:hypothetical protein
MTALQKTDETLVYQTGVSLADLEKQLQPARDFEVKRELAALLVGMKMRAEDEAGTRALIAVYSRALEGKPLVAVQNAIAAFLRGEVPGADPVFFPSCPELCAEVRRQFLMLVRVPEELRPVGEDVSGKRGPRTDEELARHYQVMAKVHQSLVNMDVTPVEETEASNDKKETEQKFKRFAPTWPTWVTDSEQAARREWAALPPAERDRAIELAPAYLAAEKAAGRNKTCALSVYLSERRWEKLAPSAVKALTGERQELPAYGKAWMAWRLQLLATMPARPWQPTAAQRSMIAAGKGHLFDDNRRNAKYPLVHALDIDAERGLGRRLKPGEEVPDADSFVRIKRGSDEWHAWAQWHQERDWPWINPPKHVEWIFMPSPMPSAGDATGAEQAA